MVQVWVIITTAFACVVIVVNGVFVDLKRLAMVLVEDTLIDAFLQCTTESNSVVISHFILEKLHNDLS